MSHTFSAFLGIPLVVFGTIGVSVAPRRWWGLMWPSAALVALVTAGVNFWHYMPIEDGAFQSLRAGVPDPYNWPAAPFLHALALAPVGLALAAFLPGPGQVAPLLLASAAAVVSSGVGLEIFADSMLRDGVGAGLVTCVVLASASLVLFAMRGGHPVQRAITGQAAVLAALCLVLWLEWSMMT